MKKALLPGVLVFNNATAEAEKAKVKNTSAPILRAVVFNLGGKVKTRYETLEGRQQLVVPMVMLTEGVHEGSQGKLLYPGEELKQTPEVWNGKPIVVYHPTINGQGVSACDPLIFNSRKIGTIFNTKYDGRLASEAWLDVEKTKEVDDRILPRIEKGEMTELSTGLWTSNEQAEGVWNGENYTAVARNYKPDHLAILPDQVGACSNKDGAGLLRNAAFSHEHSKQLLGKAIAKKTGRSYGYAEDIVDGKVVYQNDNGELMAQAYDIQDTGTEATLRGAPELIHRVVQYRKTDGTVVGNVDWSLNQERQKMNKAALIALILANGAGVFSEADKAFLEAKSEKDLEVISNKLKPATTTNTTPEVKPMAPVLSINTEKKPTLQESLDTLHPDVRKVVVNAINAENRQKEQLIKTILENKRNTFTKEALALMDLEPLQSIANLAGFEKPNGIIPLFAGMGGEVQNAFQVPATETPLEEPTWKFEPIAPARAQ